MKKKYMLQLLKYNFIPGIKRNKNKVVYIEYIRGKKKILLIDKKN